jgi:hypothetical protein
MVVVVEIVMMMMMSFDILHAGKIKEYDNDLQQSLPDLEIWVS